MSSSLALPSHALEKGVRGQEVYKWEPGVSSELCLFDWHGGLD